MTKDEAMKMALEALELHAEQYPHMQKGYTVDAITALRQALEQPEQELTGRQLQRMKQQAWKKIRAEDKDDPELCFALGFDAGYDAVARRVEPPEMESGGGFESRPASLEQPEQEPVAYLYHDTVSAEFANPLADSTLLVLACDRKPNGRNETPLYTAPPKREWKGMTDKEIQQVVYDLGTIGDLSHDEFDIARAVAQALKERNT